jgi:ribosome-associated protein
MNTTEPDWNDTDAPEPPSKSELKRQMHSRQKLGEKLTQLNPAQLATIPLDSTLREAMADYQRFKHKEARRRQLQFIGRLMRNVDVEAIEQAHELTQAGSEASKKIQHKLEQWRDRLIEEGDDAINEALVEFPQMDRQVVRQLVRDALKEKTNNKPPAAYRKLFQYIRQHNAG